VGNPICPAINFKEAIKLTKIELIDKLASLPEQIELAEKEVIKSVQAIQGAKERLTFVEDQLLVSGAIDGKNAEIRAAQLRAHTLQQRADIQDAENKASGTRVALNRLNNELAICRAIAGMLKGAE